MSTIHVSPYVNLQGRAREAMEFYQRVLGGTLDLYTIDEQGTTRPAGPEDRITLARLDSDGARIYASDGHPSYPPTVGDNLALTVGGTDGERLTAIFNALAEGGKIKGSFAEQPSGGATGWLADRFGINWMVTIEQA